jgi:hypothetical protein
MKTHTSITIDVDVLIAAKREIPNLSGEINKYLMYRLGLANDDAHKTAEQLQAERDIKLAEAQRLNKNLEKLKKQQAEEAEKNKVLYSWSDEN